jgi:hypothetical protein
MKSKTLIRFHDRDGGWFHAFLIKRGRKWAIVRDFTPPKRSKKSGKLVKRNRKVRIEDVAEPLWEAK